MTGLQFIALFAALLLSYASFLNYKRKDFTLREYAAWQVIWLMLGFVTLLPQQFAGFSAQIGALRPLDFFTIIGFVVVLSISYYTYVNVDRLRKRIEYMLRQLAISEREDGEGMGRGKK